MNTDHVIYSQDYAHKGHEFSVWSYVGGGGIRFACQGEGLSLKGLGTREEAIAKARAHLSLLAAEGAEPDTEPEVPPQREQCQQAELELELA
jgi:hypothetical protein